MVREDFLLENLKKMAGRMNANYQPIVIKMLLEDPQHIITIQNIRKKFDELNFGRGNFVSTDGGNPMGNSAIKSVREALRNFVKFPEGTSNGNVTLIEKMYDEKTKDECLKICGQEIIKWHIKKLMSKENECYFIQAGEDGKYFNEFIKNNFISVDYFSDLKDIENYDLSGMTKNEITNKNKSSTGSQELFNISNIKKGDIIAVVIGIRSVKEFAIAISDYYFKPTENIHKHRIDVEYLNFGTSEIKSIQKGIIKDAQNKIKDFLTEDNLEYFLLRYNGKDSIPKTQEQWRDVLGEQYHFGQGVANQKAIREAGIGTKTIWYKTKNLPGFYFWGFGSVQEIRTNQDDRDWNLIYSDFKYFEQGNDSIEEQEVFLQRSNESIEEQIKDLPGYNQNNSIIKITKKIYQQITGEDLTPEEDEIDTVAEHSRTIDILERKKNIILYGPPGTGKTFTAEKIAKQMNGVTKFVTFHQSYGYEEFIEGIRPQSTDNVITYPVKPGVFKKFCQSLPIMHWRQAAIYVLNEKDTSLHYTEITKISIELEISPKDTWQFTSGHPRKTPYNSLLREMTEDIRTNNENSIFKKSLDDNGKEISAMYELNKKSSNYENEIMELESLKKSSGETPKIFIIDEINRGNISKIFGELITIIENNKRGKEVTLSYSGEQFSVPSNVYIIGTMNTADQSLTHIDAALKRRFSSIEVVPNSSKLKKGMKGLPELLDTINEKVIEKISRDNRIGHAYFMQEGIPITEIKELQFVFATDIIPLLRDYFHDSEDDLKEVLGEEFIDWKEGSDRNVKEDWQNNPETFRTAIKKAYNIKI